MPFKADNECTSTGTPGHTEGAHSRLYYSEVPEPISATPQPPTLSQCNERGSPCALPLNQGLCGPLASRTRRK